jgi:hypothetical protein
MLEERFRGRIRDIQVALSEATVLSEGLALFEQVRALQRSFALVVVLEELLSLSLLGHSEGFQIWPVRAVRQVGAGVEEEPCFSDCRPP